MFKKTMDDKLIYIPNYDTQNYPSLRLQLVFETFEQSTTNKIQEVSTLMNKKMLI